MNNLVKAKLRAVGVSYLRIGNRTVEVNSMGDGPLLFSANGRGAHVSAKRPIRAILEKSHCAECRKYERRARA